MISVDRIILQKLKMPKKEKLPMTFVLIIKF